MATILVVDDLSPNREFLVTLLRYKGHRMLEAVNGSEGLAAIQAERPDLVITDVLMPVMDGYEFVRQLRLDPSTANIPVVFHTAHYGAREAKALALSSGVSYVLTKPAEPEDVLRVVDEAMSGKRESEHPPRGIPLTPEFDREHLRLLTDKLSEHTGDLRTANARLRALINIGLELASQRDSDALLRTVCDAARELFTANYVTLGILDRSGRKVQKVVSCGMNDAGGLKTGNAVAGLLADVVTARKTVRGSNATGDPTLLGLPATHPAVKTYLAAPIASPAHVYGWLFLASESAFFTEDDEHLIIALSGQVGRIYENGYYYAVAQRRAEDLENEILERKQVEAELRQEHDRAQRYLDTAQIILLALDLNGRITLVNQYACSLLGWEAEELIGRDWIETCLPPRIRGAIKAQFNNLVEGDLSIVENPVLTRSGDERLIEWRNTVIRDHSGHVTGTLSSGADITERSKAVDALRSAEERMRFALESANIGIWDMDYTTGTLRWSAILETHYGWEPGTFDGTFEAFVKGIHPEDSDTVLQVIGAAMKTGTDFETRHRTIWPDGTVRWLAGAGRIQLGENGEPVRGVGISLDVTESRTLEEQYQQAQKMEAVGRLAGGVAHDFNNLLTAILGYCELLLADLASNDPRRADISEIQKAGTSAAGLTRQLLAFSRRQMIQPTLLDVNEVVSEMRAMFGRLIGEDVKVAMALDKGIAPVKADRGQVEQIILNLVVNARDAMQEGGILTIETADVELDENYFATHLPAPPGRYVALIVTDTGTGMTEEVKARLFEPFFTTKELGKGTGLGLATVHGIVKQSGGTVNVYSELGKGTSFKVYLPWADPSQFSAEGPAPVRPRSGTQTILVVEDSDGLRALTRRLLERNGYKVLLAANAEEALKVFAANSDVTVLLTDVVMPGASGPELTKKLIEQRPALKVIYMSGYTEEAIVNHGVLEPGIAFLHKPFTSETLARKVREVLER